MLCRNSFTTIALFATPFSYALGIIPSQNLLYKYIIRPLSSIYSVTTGGFWQFTSPETSCFACMWQILRRSLRCPVILEDEITTLIFRWLSVCSRIYACRWGRHHVRLLAQDRIGWAGKFRLDCVLCSLHMGNIVTTFSVVLDCRFWEKPPVIGRKRTLQKTRTKWRNDTGWLLFLSLSLSFALFFCTSNTVLTSSAVRPCLQRLPNLAWTGKCQLGIRKH